MGSRSRDNGHKSDVIDIEVKLVHETDKAWLVEYNEDEEPVWVPMSVGELEKIPNRHNTYTLTIPQRFAEQKGLV